MNKLNFEKVKQLFWKKYPEGKIYKEEGSFHIVFQKGGKMYTYKAKNHLQLLKKINIEVEIIYHREYRALLKEKERIERELLIGYIPGNKDWGTEDYILSPLEKEQRRKRLEEIEEIIKESYIF